MELLILSYHFLPMNAIASYRAKAYIDYFYKYGIYPTLITHYWDDQEREDGDVSVEETQEYRIIRIPLNKKKEKQYSKIKILKNWFSGVLDTGPGLEFSYSAFAKFTKKHLLTNKYDLMMGIYSPHHHLKLCYQLNQQFSIPYILDFRDLWDNRIIHSEYSPNWKEKLQDLTCRYYWAKWLSNASAFTITSAPWRDKLSELTETPGYVIRNGFEANVLNRNERIKNEKFTILHSGSLYFNQDLEVFWKGLKQFIEVYQPVDFKVEFIGAKRTLFQSSINSFRGDIDLLIEQYQLTDYVVATERIPKDEVIKKQVSADILLFPSFPKSPGTYSGKIFEYIGSNTPVLVVPSDNSVIDELMEEINNGFSANTSEEVFLYIEKQYLAWKCGEKESENQEDRFPCSRDSQVKKMAELIINEILK